MHVVLQALYIRIYVHVLKDFYFTDFYFTDHFYQVTFIYFISNLACASLEPM